LGHLNTNRWSHRCDMKLFGSNRYGVMAANSVSFGSGLMSWTELFDTYQLKMCHGLALMGHQNLLGHHNTNHWSHRCDMLLIGSNRYGVMAANSVSFGSGIWHHEHELNFLTHPSSKCAMAWHWWAIKISWDTITTIIGPICMICYFLAATDMVSWLQTMWVLAQVFDTMTMNWTFWHIPAQNVPWPGTDGPSKSLGTP
jgi:hypothetical protein